MLFETLRRALTEVNILWRPTPPENHFESKQIRFYSKLGKVFALAEFLAKLFLTRNWVRGFYRDSLLIWPLADGNEPCVRAISVIPFSTRVGFYKMHTIINASFTWLAWAPILKVSYYRAAIKPIKFVISFPMQPNPSMVVAASISQQVVNKLVFLFWFDHGKVCSQILAKYPWFIPCWGKRCISNVVAGFSVHQEACWTSICSELRS